MKKYTCLALALVLTAALLTGCGCTNQDTEITSAPTKLPTMETTRPTSAPTTMPTTEATTSPTTATSGTTTDETITGSTGTGAAEDTSAPTTARRMK